jgi:LacI family transcriptional regulator
MATIFDVAERAGVSITTVSRALNGYSDVNEETRARVTRAARALNYVPSAAARSLRGKRTNTIIFAPLLHAHAESEPFFKEFTGALALACFKHDLSLLATVADTARDTRALFAEVAGSRRADAIIIADIRPHDERIPLLREIGLPFVAFGRTQDYRDQDYPFVDVDGAAGVRAIMDRLYGLGHRRIGYLSGPFDASYALHRYSGYHEALATLGLAEDPRLARRDLQERDAVRAAVADLFALPRDEYPTALLCSNDRLAAQVIDAVQDQGLTVGVGAGQIAVAGFDDLPFSAYLRPPLTTVRQPIDATCAALLDVLGMLMKGQAAAPAPVDAPGLTWVGPRQILLTPELVIRQSG